MSALIRKTLNQAKTLLDKEYEGGTHHFHFWCPACKETHMYNVGFADRVTWQYDGNFEKPTFTPSLRYLTGTKCHVNVTAGIIFFHGDCPHDMKNQKVPLPQIPDDVVEQEKEYWPNLPERKL
jgi:hypothetical protein